MGQEKEEEKEKNLQQLKALNQKSPNILAYCVGEKKESRRSVGEEFWNHKSDAARINLQKGLVDLRQLN